LSKGTSRLILGGGIYQKGGAHHRESSKLRLEGLHNK